MLLKESTETSSKEGRVDLGGGLSVEEEVVERTMWASASMFGGRTYYRYFFVVVIFIDAFYTWMYKQIAERSCFEISKSSIKISSSDLVCVAPFYLISEAFERSQV